MNEYVVNESSLGESMAYCFAQADWDAVADIIFDWAI